MPRFVLAAALTLLAGCAGPAVVTASGPAGPDGLECAFDEASARGYVVDRAERGVYVRLRQPKRYRFGTDDSEFDVLTASAPRRRLTVTASAEDDAVDGQAAVQPSRQAREDARAVVAACAD